MSDAFVQSVALMGTVVTIQVVGHGSTDDEVRERADGVARAIDWFRHVEARCSRFEPQSEVRRLTNTPGVAVEASPVVFEAVQFALAVAEDTDGAFDPTVGVAMERRGFDREYRSGESTRTTLSADAVSFRDVSVDPDRRTITLARPLVLDLGAVAKGLAVDMAARELEPFGDFAIDAGGDLYLSGHNAAGDEWAVGIRHPRAHEALLGTVRVSNAAVCTSGDYEQPGSGAEGHHIIDARSGSPAAGVASATVMAPSAMVADALATAVFVLGPVAGLELLERHGVEGLIITPGLGRFATSGMRVE